jgi:glycosyltransferase involved in cell wall biosynthesis
MRVLLLTEIPSPYRLPLFNALAERVELRVLFLGERDPTHPYPIYPDELRFDSRVLPGWRFVRGRRWIVLSRGVSAELRDFQPDVVIVGGWNQPAYWQAAFYSRRSGHGLIGWVESTPRDLRTHARILEFAKRLHARYYTVCLVPGRASADYARSLGVPEGRIVIGPNAVDPGIFGRRVAELRLDRDRVRRELGLDGRTIVLAVGRLEREKGFDVLVSAARDLAADVVIAGAGSAERELRAAAPGNVRLLGWVDRDALVPWYAAADVFVLPSRSEQWGMVLNEAAAAALPLVATEAAGGAWELIEDGVNGFRVPPDDVGALRHAIERLVEDSALRARAASRSATLAEAFTPTRWADAVVEACGSASTARPRILVLSEIPTPYRLPLYQRLYARADLDVDIVFCARDEPDRPWAIESALRALPHRVLRGVAPRVRTRRNTFVYQINPGILRLLGRTDYDAVVIGGYAVFAEQVAIVIARLRRIPYLLHSESNLLKSRGFVKRLLKEAFVRPIVRGAAGGLAAGTAAARYLEYYGMDPAKIRIVPNTIDVAAYRQAADRAREGAAAIFARWNLPKHFILFAGRLVEAKGVEDLFSALALLGDKAPVLVVAGTGPLADQLPQLADIRHVGFVQQHELIELLALADWTVVPSHVEPWGVIVNEALACGCPVITSDAVGAAEDLITDGVNGRVVPPHDPVALATALSGARPPGDTSRGQIEGWNYDLGIAEFVAALRATLPGRVTAE